MTSDQRWVHFLRAGRAACGLPREPGSWFDGHYWSSRPEEITCTGCRFILGIDKDALKFSPGLYIHLDGRLYRALFDARMEFYEKGAKPGAIVSVGIFEKRDRVSVTTNLSIGSTASFEELFKAASSSNAEISPGAIVVVHVALHGDGRAFVRDVDEFLQIVDGVPRFLKVGP